MAKVLSTSAVYSRLGTRKEPLAPTRNVCYPGVGSAGIARRDAGRWSKCVVSCSRAVRTRATSKADSSPSSASTQLVELPRKAVDIVEEFYDLVNQRDYVSVSSLFAEDCFYEDFTFPEPVKGREEILKFFEKVMTSMGPELKFAIDDITRDDPDTVGVIWHLEWRGKQFPFSRGCSFYRCEVNSSGQRQIKFARDIVEPATKPGDIAMGAIKLVTGLFEKFPNLLDRI
ncbi:hypothetical protein Mapa_008564 [Marchantia paleacea]|nr:hypothetical protein Mapa_008564 [Marchantia paleacea]